MNSFSYDLISVKSRKPKLGLIVLQADETVENELHQWLSPAQYDVMISRIPSGEAVTEETLLAMETEITRSASLFPRQAEFDAIAYCCTSGASVIGPKRVSELVLQGTKSLHVTDPLTALIRACKSRNITKIALLSPYIESVSAHLRAQLSANGIETPVFGSFNEAEEAKVAWIDEASIIEAGKSLVANQDIDGLFLSCTNLKTISVLKQLENGIGKPVLSSNFALAEDLLISLVLLLYGSYSYFRSS